MNEFIFRSLVGDSVVSHFPLSLFPFQFFQRLNGFHTQERLSFEVFEADPLKRFFHFVMKIRIFTKINRESDKERQFSPFSLVNV